LKAYPNWFRVRLGGGFPEDNEPRRRRKKTPAFFVSRRKGTEFDELRGSSGGGGGKTNLEGWCLRSVRPSNRKTLMNEIRGGTRVQTLAAKKRQLGERRSLLKIMKEGSGK